MSQKPARTLALAAGVVFVLAAALATGCGGASRSNDRDGFAITVTRDFGATSVTELKQQPLPAQPGLDQILARYGRPRARESLFVNGIAANRPVAELELHGGDRVWLDQHDSTMPTKVSAVIGSFPEPFLHGIDGKRLPVRVECDDPSGGPCTAVAGKLVELGVVAGRSVISRSAADASLRVLVGPWKRLRGREFEADSIDAGPRSSGVFARFDGGGERLVVLDTGGRPARTLGAGTGFIATTAAAQRQPVWFVTGTDDAGVAAAARAFDESVIADRFALAVSRDLPVAVPLPSPKP